MGADREGKLRFSFPSAGFDAVEKLLHETRVRIVSSGDFQLLLRFFEQPDTCIEYA
jgi:hypothetical protein